MRTAVCMFNIVQSADGLAKLREAIDIVLVAVAQKTYETIM